MSILTIRVMMGKLFRVDLLFRHLNQGRREGGRAGNFYRGPRLNGGPEELDYGARNRQIMKEPYNFYRGPFILSTALTSIYQIFEKVDFF
jgi:hypothetical protein